MGEILFGVFTVISMVAFVVSVHFRLSQLEEAVAEIEQVLHDNRIGGFDE